jgi:hypothetical protein
MLSMPQELNGIRTREFKSGSGAPLLRATFVMAVAIVLLTVGCVSSEPNSTNLKPGSDISEYSKAVADAQKTLGRALSSLSTISAQSSPPSPKAVAAFSDEFQRLEVESMQLRERFQAMQARGDAYFESWHEQMAQDKEPQRRALVENQRPALQEHFQKIKALSQEGHEAFGPFLSGFRKLRNSLEKDPGSLGTQTMQETLASTRAQGEQVQRCLVAIGRELDSMSALLTPSANAKSPSAG